MNEDIQAPSRGAHPARRRGPVVFVTSSYAPRVGGLETVVAHLAAQMQEDGRPVTVVANRCPRRLAHHETVSGVAVERIFFPDLLVSAKTTRAWLAYGLSLPFAPVAAFKLWRLLRALNPAVVNVHYVSTAALYVTALRRLGLLRAPVVVSCHGSDIAADPPPTGSRTLTRWVSRRADALTACSYDLARHVRTLTGRTASVAHNGVSISPTANPAGSAQPMTLLTVGRLTEAKGMVTLIEALGVLKIGGLCPALTVAGDGSLRRSLQDLSMSLGVRAQVHFIGTVERDALDASYAACSIFVLPSYREGLGIVNLEAMAHARPVVSTAVGGIPEVVEHSVTGLLVPPRDPVALATALKTLLDDPARASAMGRRGRDRVTEHFSWATCAARYEAAYRCAARLREADGPSIPILLYHQVAPQTPQGLRQSLRISPRAFEAQMALLSLLGWRTLDLDSLVKALQEGTPLPRRRFVVTFDDAFAGVARYAAPVLARHGFTATIFASTALLGSQTALDGGPDGPDKQLLDWAGLRLLQEAGHEIGAHARTHPHLARLTPEARNDEIAGSCRDISLALGAPPTTFAYPYGDCDADTAAAVRAAGFTSACTTRFGPVRAGADVFLLPRLGIAGSLNLPRFAYRVLCAERIAGKIALAEGERP